MTKPPLRGGFAFLCVALPAQFSNLFVHDLRRLAVICNVIVILIDLELVKNLHLPRETLHTHISNNSNYTKLDALYRYFCNGCRQ